MVSYYLDTSAMLKHYIIHLATALIAHHSLQSRDLPGLTFLCADERLLAVAAAEGLAVDNPNEHP